MAVGQLTSADSKTLNEFLQRAFFAIMPSGEVARFLHHSIPKVARMADDGMGCDDLELACYHTPTYRSKLLLLILFAKHRLIRAEFRAIESSLISKKLFVQEASRKGLLDRLDAVQAHIVSWNSPQLAPD